MRPFLVFFFSYLSEKYHNSRSILIQKMGKKLYAVRLVLSLFLLGVILNTSGQSNLSYTNLRSMEQLEESHHHHKCNHDNFMKDQKIISFEQQPSPIEATLDHEKELRKQHKDGNWKPIRILTDYSNMKTTPEIANFIKTSLDPATFGFLASAYSVYPKTSITELVGQTQCSSYVIPESHRNGIANYDLVLYIGVEDQPTQQWLAQAGPCIVDAQTGRPVAGIVQLNLFFLQKVKLNNLKSNKWFGWVDTTIHEVTHVLGFSSTLFNSFINSQTNQKLATAQVNIQQGGRSWITMPGVVAEAKSHFNCDSSFGAPLENGGGDGTAGSHWERTTFGNEAMTGSDFPGMGGVYSKFTFKLLEGTGWYLPNYDFAQQYLWGKNEGCAMESGQCAPANQEFCSATQNLCAVDYMGIAACSGDDPLGDGCKFWTGFSNSDCRHHKKTEEALYKSTGGFAGKGGRCWASTIPQTIGYTDSFTSCYKSQCINQGTQISFTVGSQDYVCTSDGQVINVAQTDIKGSVTCPAIARFCAYENNCPGDCQGRGTCKGTVCQCWGSFTGEDCATQA